jgi:hypothetical protein
MNVLERLRRAEPQHTLGAEHQGVTGAGDVHVDAQLPPQVHGDARPTPASTAHSTRGASSSVTAKVAAATANCGLEWRQSRSSGWIRMRLADPLQVVKVLATDRGSLADIPAWAEDTGNELLANAEEDGALVFWIRKASDG